MAVKQFIVLNPTQFLSSGMGKFNATDWCAARGATWKKVYKRPWTSWLFGKQATKDLVGYVIVPEELQSLYVLSHPYPGETILADLTADHFIED